MYKGNIIIDDFEKWRKVDIKYPLVLKPYPALEQFVNCYWLSAFTGTYEEAQKLKPKKIIIIPDGGSSMVFDINYSQNTHDESIWGVMDHPVTQYNQHSVSKGEIFTFAVDFKPGGLYRFLGVPMNEFLNASHKLESVSHLIFNELSDRIVNARSVGEQINIIENFLLKRLTDYWYNPSVSKALELMHRSSGGIRIRELSERLAVSERTLNRMFHEYVGIPPKMLSRIIRVQSIIKLCRDEKQSDFLMAAVDSGYFDQSHFIKDFKEFCGTTPGGFGWIK